MLRILIADCAPLAWQAELETLGARTNAALFEDALRLHDAGLTCHLLCLADAGTLSAGTAVSDFDGVVFTGSPMHINDPGPEIRRQVDFAREVFASDVPSWGSCWGLQLAAVALGGAARINPRGREIGVARGIAPTAAGRAHPLLAGRPAAFDVLCTHLDEVQTLPPGGVVLAGNEMSAIQAAAMPTPGGGGFWGVQYHPEIDLAFVSAVVHSRAARLAAEGFGRSEDDVRAVAADYMVLGRDVTRRDLAWRHGISDAILDRARRSVELGNWLRCEVRPRRAA